MKLNLQPGDRVTLRILEDEVGPNEIRIIQLTDVGEGPTYVVDLSEVPEAEGIEADRFMVTEEGDFRGHEVLDNGVLDEDESYGFRHQIIAHQRLQWTTLWRS